MLYCTHSLCVDSDDTVVLFLDIEYPEQRKLPLMQKVPTLAPGERIKTMTKQLIDIRGPELTENYLIHKQYGVRVCIR